MSSNVIYNNNDETIGYYNDLYKIFTEEIKRMLDGHDIEGAKEQMEYLEELSDLANYDGLVILSMNNGMGFTAKPYAPEKGEQDGK